VALLTPFRNDGSIDEAILMKLVEYLIAKGVSGFYVCGSTGEAFLMSIEERQRVLEMVIEQTKGRATIICHIGAIGTQLSILLGEHAREHGADVISSIPPFYYKFTEKEIIGYYHDLANIGLPFIPYNFPALSGVAIDARLMAELRKNPNIVGIKFTSNDLFQMERMKAADPDLIVMSGYDELFLGALSMGADGAIGSTFNVMPKKFIKIFDYYKHGKIEDAQKEQRSANEVIHALISTGKLLNAHKYLLELQGFPFGECRKPFLPLNEEDKANLRFVHDRCLMADLN
jgi:N-acetylneuraminate lyase